jgi:hypothetical protein
LVLLEPNVKEHEVGVQEEEQCHNSHVDPQPDGQPPGAIVPEGVEEASDEEAAGQAGHRNEEPEEFSVVLFSDAVVEPLAVVVEVLDAAVTHPAVLAGVGHMGVALTAEELTVDG